MTTDLDRPTDPDANDGPPAADPAEEPRSRRSTTPRPRAASAAAGSKTAVRRPARPRPATTGADDAGATAGRSAGLGASPRLPWLLALLGLLGTLGFGVAWWQADDGGTTVSSGDGPSAAMLTAAEDFSEALTNFDGATIDRDTDRIVARSTGEFRDQVDEFFGSDVRKQLKEAQASSRGEVRSAFVQAQDGDRGSVFVVADQTIANNQSPKPRSDTLRMELGMERVDGRWRVARVDVLTAPSGGSTSAAGLDSTPTSAPVAGD